jgi:hypothetical protein
MAASISQADRQRGLWRALAALLSGLALVAPVGSAASAPPAARAAALFALEGGGEIVFDRSHDPPLVKFANRGEIWALKAAPGPRGDTLYASDVGAVLVRAAKIGGVTVYTAAYPNGAAAAYLGPAPALAESPPRPGASQAALRRLKTEGSHLAGRPISVDAPPVADEAAAALLAEAAENTLSAVTTLASRPEGAGRFKALTGVQIAFATAPGARLLGGVLHIDLARGGGVGGRPSSALILRALDRDAF